MKLTAALLISIGIVSYANFTPSGFLQSNQILSSLGHSKAQYKLGRMYDTGRGVKQDNSEAVKWYRKSAEQGNPKAQNNLGRMYTDGLGVKQDNFEALKLVRNSAEQGDHVGQYNLGYMYAHGKGIEQNFSEAVKWYRKSAEQGYPNAQFNLGQMYATGNGVEQDFSKTFKWARKSAEQGHAQAKYYTNRFDTRYESKEDHKAIAVNSVGNLFIAFDRTTPELAVNSAMESCRGYEVFLESSSKCKVVNVDGQWVKNLVVESVDKPVSGVESLITNSARKSYETEYMHEEKPKVFAQSSIGDWKWLAKEDNDSSLEDLKARTLKACNIQRKFYNLTVLCEIVSVNGDWVN